MATTTPFNSTALRIYADGVAIANALDANLSINNEMINITTKDSEAWEEFMAGVRNGTLGGSGLYANGTVDALWSAIENRTSIEVKFGTAEVGEDHWTATGFFTSLSLASPGYEQAATFDFQIQITGAIQKA